MGNLFGSPCYFLLNLRMFLNMDLVIGGQTGIRIGPQMKALVSKAAQLDRFARDINYIFPCIQQKRACALGTAGFAMEQFGDKLFHKAETTS